MMLPLPSPSSTYAVSSGSQIKRVFYCRFNEKGRREFPAGRLKMKSLTTENHLRHVESLATLPSGAGKIPQLNSMILGEAMASEENDLIYPSEEFSLRAHVPKPAKVIFCTLSLIFLNWVFIILLKYIKKWSLICLGLFWAIIDVGFNC